jgi:[acyl-carrier-protein] S-malonyltransferase
LVGLADGANGFDFSQCELRNDTTMGEAAVIFPGQGSQLVGMGKDVAESCGAARDLFGRANDVLGFDIARLCFEGPAEELEKTDVQQLAIFLTSCALWVAFVEAGGSLKHFVRAGGLSLGEYTAFHVAGALVFEDALRLVRRRGQLMQQAALASPSGMVSLLGADEAAAQALCDRARREGEVLRPANFNCPGQVVISGSRSACERATEMADEFNCRPFVLPVAGAFHSALMAPAGEGLKAVLAETGFLSPKIPVIANVNAEYHGQAGEIRESLVRQVTEPILWQRCVERMIKEGCDCFVEVGPGRVLTGLMRKINRKMTAITVNSAASIETAVAQLAAN